MQEKIENFLEKYNLLNSKIVYLTAFSGGADSLCLLDNLANIVQKYKIKLIAMHVNHNWRGEESDMEMEFCKNFCKTRNIEFKCKILDKTLKHTELTAREARIDFFIECAKNYQNSVIFTGHTATDNMETLIYRITKGTGLYGIQGILPKNLMQNIPFYRPLMEFSRSDTIAYCDKNSLKYNTDSSNEDTKYNRNLIRHEIVPKLKQINKNAEVAFNTLASLAQIQSNILSEYTNDIKNRICNTEHYDTKMFLNLSEDVQQQLIYDLLANKLTNYDCQKVLNILDFIKKNSDSKSGSRCSLSENLWLFVSEKEFYLINELQKQKIIPIKISKCGEYEFGEFIFSLLETSHMPDFYPPDNEFLAYVDLYLYKNDFTFELRNRMEGDVIMPLGMKSLTKLKKYMISKAIPQHERNEKVLLCKNNEVLWAAGIGMSEKIKTVQNPSHMLKLRKR